MMRHPEYHELNDFVDRLLPAARAEEVGAHVAGCGECADTVARIALLHDAAAALPREDTPPAHVWQAIRAATVDSAAMQQRRVLWRVRYRLAAAALVVLIAGSSATWWLTRQHNPSVTATARVARPVDVNLAAYRSAEANYNRTTDELLAVLNQRRASMDPSVVRTVEENMRIIDQAIARAREALLSDPANHDIASALTTAHESKIRMLNRAVRRSGAT
jgi:hypothetical protein